MKNNKLSIFGGNGFIGRHYCKTYPNCIIQERNDRKPITNNILYFISTVDNYNIFKDITLDVETNLKVLCEVMDNCKENDMTINFVSSWFVYGDTKMPASESSICFPKGFYSITKKAAEDLLISFCETYKQKYRILRLCNVMGLGDKKSSSKKNALTHIINLLKKNKEVCLYDKGKPTRDILHVSDICEAIRIVCNEGEENTIYNIGRGEPTEIGYIIDYAKKILNSSSIITYVEAPEFHKIVQVKDFSMDTRKVRQLGFKPKYSVNKIIEELCQ